MRTALFALAIAVASVATAAGGILGCAAASPATAQSAEDARKLPPYSGESVTLFDDAIEPHAVGLELEASANPHGDRRLRLRAEAADVVARARVTTVTGKIDGTNQGFQIALHMAARLGGKHPLGDDFTVDIDKNSPAVGIVRNLEGRLVGHNFVIFVKAFVGPEGERVLHFHAMADSPDAVAAVKDAVILDEAR